MKRYLSLAVGLTLLFGGCGPTARVPQHPTATVSSPRNIIMVIGDGMGPQQLALAEIYYQRTKDPRVAALNRFIASSVHGTHIPLPERSLVNDSACAASQLAGGCRCEPRSVGIDVHGTQCHSVAREAKVRGMRVGLVSDTRITHATPAAFFAHVRDRDSEHEIAEQLIESEVDLMLSGGVALFIPGAEPCSQSWCPDSSHKKFMRTDGRNLLNEARARGFSVIHSDGDLAQSSRLPLLGLFSPLYMADAFQEARRSEPSLAQMTEKALTLLDSEKGFFLMVEAGQIDAAAHLNDAGWVLAEMLRLSSVLEVIEQFTKERDDTLVLLTGDHETGGMGLSYRKAALRPAHNNQHKKDGEELDFLDVSTLQRLRKQKLPIAEALRRSHSQDAAEQRDRSGVLSGAIEQATGERLADDVLDEITDANASTGTLTVGGHCSIDKDFYPYGAMKLAARAGRAVGASQGVVWATGTHTTTPVPVMARGPMSERFVRWQWAGDVGRTLLDLVSRSSIVAPAE